MDWRDEYNRKLMTAEEAAKLVQSGDVVAVGGSTDQPQALQQAIFARRDELRGVKVVQSFPVTDPGWLYPGAPESFEVIIIGFVGPLGRPVVAARQAEFVPNTWVTSAKALERSPEKDFDVFLMTLSPPNQHGFCSLGPMLWIKRSWMRRAKTIIAEVDRNIRWIYGNTTVHVSEVDHFVEHTSEAMSDTAVAVAVKDLEPEKQQRIKLYTSMLLPTTRTTVFKLFSVLDVATIDTLAEKIGLKLSEADEKVVKAIAGHLSLLINSGDCFQIGYGARSNFLYQFGAFEGKEDLGYHGEMAARGVATMIREGQITGRHKTLMPGKAVLSAAEGLLPEELEFVVENPQVEFYDTTWVTRPEVIAQNDNMVSIQNGISVDLTGQINAETIFGGQLVYGPGGEPESQLGAILSKGGRSIIMLPSSAVGGTVSTIVSQFEPGIVVTIPRCYADYIVTEYGIASLMGKSLRQRAEALIAIAHPDFRAKLRKEAQKLFYQ